LWEKTDSSRKPYHSGINPIIPDAGAVEMKNDLAGVDFEEKNMKRPCHLTGPFGSQALLFA